MRKNTTRWMAVLVVGLAASWLGCGDDDSGGSGDPDPHVKVFVTSLETTDGNLGGLSGADLSCTLVAKSAGLEGQWTAWLSDEDEDAGDRILDSEYRLLNGEVLATGKADLLDGSLNTGIYITESGEPLAFDERQLAWTGTAADGTLDTDPEVRTCDNWSSLDGSEVARVGNALAANASWTRNVNTGCQAQARLYCFSAEEMP